MNFPTREQLESMRALYPAGTRIELTQLDDPYTSLRPGDQGTVDFLDDGGTLHVVWDSGSALGVIIGVDGFVKI